MFNNPKIQRIVKSTLWIISIVLVVVLTSFVLEKANKQTCVDVKISIPGANNLVERQDIDAILEKTSGQLMGVQLKSINMYALEKQLNKNPYISKSKIYSDINGVLHIEITQKQPVIRILNKFGNDFYIDSEGKKMPISSNFTPRVLVATGNITERLRKSADTLQTQLAHDLFAVANYINQNELWTAQIVQLYVNPQLDIEMVPRVGNQVIVLGNAENLDEKFKKLLVFYKQAMPKVGWNTYKTINLKFNKQIVCEKNDSTLLRKEVENVQQMQKKQEIIQDLIQTEIQKQLQTPKKD